MQSQKRELNMQLRDAKYVDLCVHVAAGSLESLE